MKPLAKRQIGIVRLIKAIAVDVERTGEASGVELSSKLIELLSLIERITQECCVIEADRNTVVANQNALKCFGTDATFINQIARCSKLLSAIGEHLILPREYLFDRIHGVVNKGSF